MQNNHAFSLRRGLTLLLIMVTAGFLVIGGLGIVGNYHGSRSLRSLHDDQVVPLHQIKVLVESYGMRVQNAILRLDAGELTVEEGIAQIQAAQDSIEVNWRAYRSLERDSSYTQMIGELDQALGYADMEIGPRDGFITAQGATIARDGQSFESTIGTF